MRERDEGRHVQEGEKRHMYSMKEIRKVRDYG